MMEKEAQPDLDYTNAPWLIGLAVWNRINGWICGAHRRTIASCGECAPKADAAYDAYQKRKAEEKARDLSNSFGPLTAKAPENAPRRMTAEEWRDLAARDGRYLPHHSVGWLVVNDQVCRKRHDDFINDPCVFEFFPSGADSHIPRAKVAAEVERLVHEHPMVKELWKLVREAWAIQNQMEYGRLTEETRDFLAGAMASWKRQYAEAIRMYQEKQDQTAAEPEVWGRSAMPEPQAAFQRGELREYGPEPTLDGMPLKGIVEGGLAGIARDPKLDFQRARLERIVVRLVEHGAGAWVNPPDEQIELWTKNSIRLAERIMHAVDAWEPKP